METSAREIILDIMKEAGINQTQLAKMMGMKNQSNVSEALKRDMKYSLFFNMVDALGYEIIIQKKKRGRKSVGKAGEDE